MNKLFNSINSFYHKLGSFPWFYKISSISIPYVFVLAFIFLIIGLGWGILYSPTDLQQGDVYRIIYMHVPAASVSQSIYYTMTVAAAVSKIL
jgi:heme exporter protein C